MDPSGSKLPTPQKELVVLGGPMAPTLAHQDKRSKVYSVLTSNIQMSLAFD